MAQKKAAEAVPAARGSSSSSSSRICSGPCSASSTATWSRSRTRSASISPRAATKVQIEGEPEAAARARDVLVGLYNRLDEGQDVDAEAVDAIIGMSAQPTLDGIIAPTEVAEPPKVMIRTRKKTIVPRSARCRPSTWRRWPRRHDLRARARPAPARPISPSPRRCQQLIGGSVDRLILSRPAVEAGERLGFLPGDMKEKVDPYLRPLYDALYDMLPAEQVERRIASGEIEIAPIAFMRGRTLNDAFIILDEAQNTTPAQMKMFLTRFGMRSRMVICGDPLQVDLPDPGKSGLADAVGRLEGSRASPRCRFTAGRRRPPPARRADRRGL
jgi:phosphate starvation-inducible PhoH-like protein